MKLNFFKRMAEKVREPLLFTKLEETLSEIEPDTVVTAKDDMEEPTSEKPDDRSTEQVRLCLLKNNKPIGKPFNRNSAIRIVYVDNFVGAFLFFLRTCDQRLLSYSHSEDYLNCTANFTDGSGKLSFTDKVACRNKAVIAVMKVEITDLEPQISEIRFEVKH